MRHSLREFRRLFSVLFTIGAVLSCGCGTMAPRRGLSGETPGGAVGPPAGELPGVLLEDLTWQQAEPRLTAQTLVVLPIGAAAKEHGPHLLLKNDHLLAEYLKRRLLVHKSVVVAPTVNYNYYPAFVEYPGSTTLRLETARNLIVDICRSLARHGPRRFYALNTGVSTVRALELAKVLLAREGILLTYTDLLKALGPIEKQVGQQAGGTHADESETSMVLYIAPQFAFMQKAVRDFHPRRLGPFSRNPDGPGTYSPTGTWGDPTLATPQKGARLVEGLVQVLLRDLDALERAPLPTENRPEPLPEKSAEKSAEKPADQSAARPERRPETSPEIRPEVRPEERPEIRPGPATP